MTSLKAGVHVGGVQPEALIALIVVQSVYRDLSLTCVVTSCVDGKHKVDSLHYQGLALDLRTKHVSRDQLDELVRRIREALGEEYDVVLEARGAANEHLHVEHDP